MGGARLWSLGMMASVALHAGGAAVLLPFLAPEPVPQQAAARARLDLATMSVPAEAARSAAPDARAAREDAPGTSVAGQGQVASVRAAPAPAVSNQAPPVAEPAIAAPAAPAPSRPAGRSSPAPVVAAAFRPGGEPVATGEPQAVAVTSAAPARQAGPAVAPPVSRAAIVRGAADVASDALPPPDIAPRGAPLSSRVDTIPAPGETLTGLYAPGTPLRTTAPSVASATSRPAPGAVAAQLAPGGEVAASPPLPSETTAALLAWSGDLRVELRQPTLEAAAALRVPDPDPGGQGLRDALTETLVGVTCGRAQTSYDPATGAIDLLGHVRTDADRDRLVAALRADLDDAIPVIDRLRRLGDPQCGVLSRLAALALPQSVEQFVNPLILGADLEARAYAFAAGQTMRFDLVGADYDGWLTLDYYDGAGQVLHLVPNAAVPPVMLPAKATLAFGGGGPDDIARGRIELRVSPPFGRDIAVAAVTSRPLFDAPRPTVEPADGYLAELAARLDRLRGEDGRFRGEWVYLFVETGPADAP